MRSMESAGSTRPRSNSGRAMGWVFPGSLISLVSSTCSMTRDGITGSAALSLVSSGPGQPVSELSGGNQQKVTVARALAHHPSLIVAITPTRGVDVASKELLLRSLAEVATASGAGVLLCTDELSDLVICDRVVVFVRGEVFTEFSRPPFDRDELILATEGMAGTVRAAAYNAAEEAAQ